MLTNFEAEKIANENRAECNIPEEYSLQSTMNAFIEITEGDVFSVSVVKDEFVALVTFKRENAWAECAVSHSSKKIVRVRFSR